MLEFELLAMCRNHIAISTVRYTRQYWNCTRNSTSVEWLTKMEIGFIEFVFVSEMPKSTHSYSATSWWIEWCNESDHVHPTQSRLISICIEKVQRDAHTRHTEQHSNYNESLIWRFAALSAIASFKLTHRMQSQFIIVRAPENGTREVRMRTQKVNIVRSFFFLIFAILPFGCIHQSARLMNISGGMQIDGSCTHMCASRAPFSDARKMAYGVCVRTVRDKCWWSSVYVRAFSYQNWCGSPLLSLPM